MTNRTLSTLVIRFAALLLFIQIFNYFGTYAWSVFSTAVLLFTEQKLNASFDRFYFHGVFLLISNVVISLLLFFKADWISSRIIKEDKEVTIQLTAEKLIMSVVLITGVLWLADSIFALANAYDYLQAIIAKIKHLEFHAKVNFSPGYFVAKTVFGILFTFRTDKVTRFVMKRMNRYESASEAVKSDETSFK